MRIARRDGREIGTEFRADYCINDWLAAVNELGGQWAPSVDHSDRPFEERQNSVDRVGEVDDFPFLRQKDLRQKERLVFAKIARA